MSPERYTHTGERLTPLFEHASAHGPVQAVRVDYAQAATPNRPA